jgi:phosphatidylglycerophosphatase A
MEGTRISNKNPSFSALLRSPTLMLAFGFGSGLAPKAPGTFGTLAAIPFWLLLCQLPISAYWGAVAISAIFGIYICGRALFYQRIVAQNFKKTQYALSRRL